MWTIFKFLTEFVTVLLLSYVWVFWPHSMWDLTSLTVDQTHTPCIERQSLNPWAAREVPTVLYNIYHFDISKNNIIVFAISFLDNRSLPCAHMSAVLGTEDTAVGKIKMVHALMECVA